MNVCCDIAVAGLPANNRTIAGEELQRAAHRFPDGRMHYVLTLTDMDADGNARAIEGAVVALEDVISARLNVTTHKLTVQTRAPLEDPAVLLDTLADLGHRAFPVDLGDLDQAIHERASTALLKAVAVAGFAAANIMLLSVSIWSGASGATRDLFHLLSALIAFPAAAYAGQVFYRSAFSALRQGRLNMDVPISLAISLALAMSLHATVTSGEEAYFDAAATLLFFLLIGRYLDQRMRERANSAVSDLVRLAAKGAMRILPGGEHTYIERDAIEPGMRLLIAAGERVIVDARVVTGASDLDRSLVTGESAPVSVSPGARLEAGTMNLTGPLEVIAERTADQSFLGEIARMMEAAGQGRSRYIRIADRMASIYAPAVHVLSFATFLGWMVATGGDWQASLYIAVAVLIVTCPCALGLAVPVVHVAAASRLFSAGVLMKDGAALERLAGIDHAVFDKTGTLTTGVPRINAIDLQENEMSILKALAERSMHPASQAIAAQLHTVKSALPVNIREIPGQGIEASFDKGMARLGRASWVRDIATNEVDSMNGPAFAMSGGSLHAFTLHETIRADASDAVRTLEGHGISSEILSGDTASAVERVAKLTGIKSFTAEQSPHDKLERLEALRAEDHHVLMIGDGLNDTPALAAAHVSMAPGSASDIGRNAADFVFTRDSLHAVAFTHETALNAQRLVRQNFGLAIAYNMIAVPLAMAGLVTPLIAAIAMSASSIVVVANSLRLSRAGRAAKETGPVRVPHHQQVPA